MSKDEATHRPDGQLIAASSLLDFAQRNFCLDQVVYAFGYGSGVLTQSKNANDKSSIDIINGRDGLDNSKHTESSSKLTEKTVQRKVGATDHKLVDLILVVRDSHQFHLANIQRNPSHYWLPPFLLKIETKANWATWWQRHDLDTWLLCNPRLSFHVTENVKYGVVQVDDLLKDLIEWSYIYLAGRMHKPIVPFILHDRNNNDNIQEMITAAQERNLHAALCCSLILLSGDNLNRQMKGFNGRDISIDSINANKHEISNTLESAEVYAKVASLSYTGDLRMTVGAEDSQKVNKLVQSAGQLARWDDLYAGSVSKLEYEGILSREGSSWKWDLTSYDTRQYMWEQLPSAYNQYAKSTVSGDIRRQRSDTLAISEMLADRKRLEAQLRTTVARTSRYQSAKGIVTAGPCKSWSYAIRKLSKGLLKR